MHRELVGTDVLGDLALDLLLNDRDAKLFDQGRCHLGRIDAVGTVRSRTTEPLLTATRAIVLGTFIAIAGTAVLALVGIGLFRLLDVVLPGESWSAHLVLGATCCALGGLLWSRRSP